NAGAPTTFSVIVRDTTAPTIAAHTDTTAEATSGAGAVITYTAPSTSDAVDGTGVASCAPASGTSFAIGTTAVSCSATDAHGNAATPTNITAEATGAAGAAVTFTACASDIVDGPVAASCSPASGSTFALGTTTVNCSATDAHANTGSASFTVTVRDTTPPTISVPADNLIAEATGPSGAAVSYSASASDVVDGAVTVTCNPASGTTFPLGATTVTCSATDAHGNSSAKTFTVTVVDTTAPAITATPDRSPNANGWYNASVTVTVSCTDNGSGVASVS